MTEPERRPLMDPPSEGAIPIRGGDRPKPEYAIRDWLQRIGVPTRLREIEIREDLLPAACWTWWESIGIGGSMILSGPIGCGKTTAAVACLRAWAKGSAPSWDHPRSARWMTEGDFFDAVFDRTNLVRKAREVDLLVLDDVGVAHRSDWPVSELDRLISDRWNERRSTIVTTNLADVERNPEAECYRRAISRLADAEGPGIVGMDGADLRKGMPEGGS